MFCIEFFNKKIFHQSRKLALSHWMIIFHFNIPFRKSCFEKRIHRGIVSILSSLRIREGNSVYRLGRTWAEKNFGRIAMEEGRSKEFIKVGKRLKVPPACIGLASKQGAVARSRYNDWCLSYPKPSPDESVLMPRFVGHRFTRLQSRVVVTCWD